MQVEDLLIAMMHCFSGKHGLKEPLGCIWTLKAGWIGRRRILEHIDGELARA